MHVNILTIMSIYEYVSMHYNTLYFIVRKCTRMNIFLYKHFLHFIMIIKEIT